MSTENQNTTEKLVDDIDTVVWNASTQIDAIDEKQFIRQQLPTAMWLLLVVPVLAICMQCIRWAAGFSASEIFSLTTWAILTCLVPVAWMLIKIANRKKTVSRTEALREADQQLGSCERIVTADQFLKQESRDGFMQAAVEDASDWVSRGCDARLQREPVKSGEQRIAYWAIPIAIAGLLLAGLLAPLTRTQMAGVSADPGASTISETITVAVDRARSEPTANEQDPPTPPPETEREPRNQPSVNRQGSANAAIPDNAEMSQGKLSEGATRESKQSANPSSAKGAPSASGQPSKTDEEAKRKPKKKKKSKPEKERETKPKKKEDEKPSGSTAGQGSSKGSDNSAAPSDWASMSQAATPDDDDNDEEDEVDDEEEEQESRGGVQPNMRDRRPPVNRDLQIGFGNPRPNPDANGRGGPSGQKKSRGVASLVLGVPIPDRINGQPNKGRIRITQQRITPEAEQSDAVSAQDRTPRQGPVGPIAEADFSPWLQDLVRRYFLQRRAKHPLKTQPLKNPTPTNAAAPTTSVQTKNAAESETPQS